MNTLNIPKEGANVVVESLQHYVVVGANGSGKSHLGAWIENNNSNTLRISAQRALNIPDIITLKSEEIAWNKILYGDEKNKNKVSKWGYSWDKKETTTLVNDYDSVLTAIFARKNKENDNYVKDCREKEARGEQKANVPLMITDKILAIWDDIFPHRRIILEDVQVKASINGHEYHAKGMSDGERVAIYLIGQCLIAPVETTIIIDEPEIHLHKSIMYKLWDNIEMYCQDKTFVYITHDLDFAASRKDATKIWVKSFDGSNHWDLSILQPSVNIPDSLMFEVLGNRKPVLFVEGERGSYDNQLYPYIYEDYNIIPCHDCQNVIAMTKAFNDEHVKSMHNLEVKGLIDRDYMTAEEVDSYRQSNIFTLDVAEIENLYLVEELIRIVASHQGFDPNSVFEEVKTFLFDEYLNEKDSQLISMCTKEIRHRLQCYTKPRGNTVEALKEQMENVKTAIDVDSIYQIQRSEVDRIIAEKDYQGLLRIYNRKSLHERVSQKFGLKAKEYPKLVLRLLKTDKKEDIVATLKHYAPQIN